MFELFYLSLTIVNKAGAKVDDDELYLTFAQLGFDDGDTIRIIARGSGGTSVTYPINPVSDFTYESMPWGHSLEERWNYWQKKRFLITLIRPICLFYVGLKMQPRVIMSPKKKDEHCSERIRSSVKGMQS